MDKAGAKGKLFVISAPSGCGKTTLGKRLLDDDLGFVNSVSVTTRKPRRGEKDGVDYHFIAKRDFLKMVREKAFLEHEDNFGNLYGTPRRPIEENLEKGRSVLLNIDVKGAMSVKKLYGAKSVLIFIMPPSIAALEKRLHLRRSDDHSTIAARLKVAKKEMSYKNRYDHIVVNDRLDDAYRELKKIIISELNN